ncbi:heat stress transcription factor A-5 [Iris pallida]|uniref:Heat stress transcription factor A-5 n=1 Tax=Iris pallida TaxID=29817 RepID=A0AAX6H963_IRIPA|nr:heat stress transcription factor A-5 [Iris pallida]
MEPPAIAGGGGPAPFLIKTYDMVDDSSTDAIVSWSSTNASFVVWNPPEFAAKLLPTYFKHNNFSSFIRQLNTYGFRKIDPERWEFANEEFIKDQKHLLKNIHRRKPIHSHSHPQGSSLSDAERIALEVEIDRLSREKTALQADLWRFRQQQTGTKIQLEDLERRLVDMEKRQEKMIAFLQRAVQNPRFVENLVKMAGSGAVDDLAMHKKRRLPGAVLCQEVSEENSGLNESGGFGDRLRLGLCSATVSDSNLGTLSTQSSNEEEGTSLHLPMKSSLFAGGEDDEDGMISCHLNLTLASSSMQVNRSLSLTRTPNLVIEEGDADKQDDNDRDGRKNTSGTVDSGDGNLKDSQEATPVGNQGPPPLPGRVNDMFWEQFLTERPGSSDTEEASSSLRASPCEEQQEERKSGNDSMWRNRKDLEQLTL